jgi:acyl dehydratase
VVHPWFLAARMAPLTRHNFTYGPTIHVRTQIQHRSEVAAGQQLIIGARIVSAHERNEHWYQVLDGMVSTAEGVEVARLRHTTIFRPRGTITPPPIVGDPPTAGHQH